MDFQQQCLEDLALISKELDEIMYEFIREKKHSIMGYIKAMNDPEYCYIIESPLRTWCFKRIKGSEAKSPNGSTINKSFENDRYVIEMSEFNETTKKKIFINYRI